MTEQLNLFGEIIEETSKKEKKTGNKKKEGKKTVPVPKDKKLPSDKILLVCYAREQFSYSLEERAELQQQAETQGVDELEIIRRELARYYPELSAERVTWHWEVEEEKETETEITETESAGEIETGENQTAENIENPEQHIVVVPVVTAGKKGIAC